MNPAFPARNSTGSWILLQGLIGSGSPERFLRQTAFFVEGDLFRHPPLLKRLQLLEVESPSALTVDPETGEEAEPRKKAPGEPLASPGPPVAQGQAPAVRAGKAFQQADDLVAGADVVETVIPLDRLPDDLLPPVLECRKTRQLS